MRKKTERGFTIVELLTSFTLATVVMILLFNILIAVKENYINSKMETEYSTQASLLSRALNEDALNCEVKSITKSDNKFNLSFMNSNTCNAENKVLEFEENKITYDGVEYKFPEGVNVLTADSQVKKESIGGFQYYMLKLSMEMTLHTTGETKKRDIISFYPGSVGGTSPLIPDPNKAYTVIYRDGASGAAFGDESHGNLKAGDTIPAFEGSLTRPGYIFTGWSPTLSPTVKPADANEDDEIIYSATWKKATATSYTVSYTDGVSGVTIFPDQSYEGLKPGDKTPAFVGTPARPGYTFMGWAPAIKGTIDPDMADEDGEIIYSATWQQTVTHRARVMFSTNASDDTVTGMPSGGISLSGPSPISYTIPSNVPVRSGYVFKGWSTNSIGAAQYQPGQTIILNSSATSEVTNRFYAIWEANAPSNALSMSVTSSTTNAIVGQQVRYTITVSNSSSVVASVWIRADLDKKVGYVSSSAGGIYEESSHTVNWSYITVPARGSTTITMNVFVIAAGGINTTFEGEAY